MVAKDGATFDLLVNSDKFGTYIWGKTLAFVKKGFIGNLNIYEISQESQKDSTFKFIYDLAKLDHSENLIKQGKL